MMTEYEINNLSHRIIEAAIEVHRNLGPGLLEQTYRKALMCEFQQHGISAAAEVEIPFTYKGVNMGTAYRADIIVENEIILELKSTSNDSPLYFKQLLTYLRLSHKRLGLLINFNNVLLRDGLHRVVNKL